jgi:hypothetical protein
MLRTIEFHHESTRPAAEIEDKSTNRKLVTEVEAAKRTGAHEVPEPLFGGSRAAAEHARYQMTIRLYNLQVNRSSFVDVTGNSRSMRDIT